MTVIVLTKEKNTYHIHGDGRTSQDWMGIASNNSKKVHEGKDCIFGICGKASAKLIMKDILNKTSAPMQVLRKLTGITLLRQRVINIKKILHEINNQ